MTVEGASPPASSLTRTAKGVTTGVAIAAVLALLYNAAAGRMLGPEAYSDFVAALALATLLAVALGAMTPIAAVLSARYTAAGTPQLVRGLVRRLLGMVAISAVVVIAIAAAAAAPVSAALRFHSAAIVVAAAVVYAGIAASTVLRAALRGAQQFGDYTRNLIAECGIRLVIGMAVLWVTRSALLAVLVYALGTLFATVSALRVVRRMSPEVMPVEMREVAALLGPATILAGAMAVFLNADLILVKRLFDPTTAGIYGAAATVARVMAIVAMPLEAVLVPRIAFHLERPRAGNDSMTRFVIGFLGVTAAPLALFGLLPHVVTSAIYGREYAAAAPLLFPLASAILFLYVAYIAAQILIAARRPWLIAVFAAAVVIEVALVILHHDSLQTVATIILSTRAAAAAVMIGGVAIRRRRT